MRLIRFVVDNSTIILGAITSLFGLLAAFGLKLTSEQVGSVMAFLGAIILILAAVVTTAKRRVVALVDDAGVLRAGQASTMSTGAATQVEVDVRGHLVPQAAVKPELLKQAG